MSESQAFSLVSIDPLHVERAPALRDFYTLSPFVWKEEARYRMLLRVVNRSRDPTAKIARIHYAESSDGLSFTMETDAAIAPGPESEDRNGCEDPTVIPLSPTRVYYSGWNQADGRGELLRAVGRDHRSLRKCGIALASSQRYANPKEASVTCAEDGTWSLFFEYARDDASQIGRATSPHVDGPWTIVETPAFPVRPEGWDSWHLSPGPILLTDPARPVMFYNGATRETKWRIGWVAFDASFTRIVDRCEAPLIVPPRPKGDETDIAFAASAVQEPDGIALYYSVADRDMKRAFLRVDGA